MKIRKARKLSTESIQEITFPNDYNLYKVGTSQSLLQSFLKCRVAYLLTLNRFKKIDARNTTGFGSMTHHCLDKIYTLFKDTGKLASNKFIDQSIDEFTEEFPEDLQGFSQQEIEKVAGLNYVILVEYMKYYSDDFEKFTFIDVEKVSKIKLDKFKLRRKTDGCMLIDGKKWIFEHKTKGVISEKNLLLQLDFDFQNLFYITCEELETGSEVYGVLYNVIRNPMHDQKNNESLKDFLSRVQGDIQKRPDHFFKRFEVTYSRREKQIFRKQLVDILTEAQKVIDGELPLYRNTTACVTFYPCEFLPACSCGKMNGYTRGKHWFPELHINQ